MRKHICLLSALAFSGLACFAQQVTVRLDGRPMAELFEAVEKQSDYRIFCTPEVSDSLTLSIDETNVEPVQLLRKALRNTPFRVSVFQKAIYIIQEKDLITSLPERSYDKHASQNGSYIPVFERATKATSETTVYNIGNPNAPPTSFVAVTGTVTDFKTGEPLTGITLLLEDPAIGTTTDAYGFYSLRLPAGRRELILRGVGMKESRRQLALFSDGKLDIELEEIVYSLAEVAVIANRIDNVRSVTGGLERLQMRNIKNIPSLMGEVDILRIVMTLPGVTSVGEISSGFNVRGGATDQNLILYNDNTIYSPAHVFGLFSSFNPDMVDNMELYKSNIPAKYGGRISSVLDIKSKEGNRKSFQGAASLGLLTSKLTMESPLFKKKGSFIAGGRTTYSDWMLKQIPEKSGYNKGSAGFYDLNASVNLRSNDNNSFYLTGYFSRDRFNFTDKDSYAYQNANFSAKWRHVFNQNFTGSHVVGHDHFSYRNRDLTDMFNAYSLDFAINQQFGKIDFSIYPNNSHTMNAGINTVRYRLNPGNYMPAHEKSIVRENRIQTENAWESAVYLSDEWKISSRLTVSGGIRYSMFNVQGPRVYNIYLPDHLPSAETVARSDTAASGILKTYHGPEYRLSLRYILDDQTSIKAGMNTMRQYIHKISNSAVMSPSDVWKLSDFNICPQTGTQYAIGLFRNLAGNMIETSVEGYYKTLNDYLDYRGGAQLTGSHIETEVVGVEGKAYGIEVMLKKVQGRLNGWVSYGYSRTLLHRHDELSSSANTSDWYPADFDKPHEVKLVGNFKFTHRLSLSLNGEYSTGRPITLPVAKYIYEGRPYIYYAERNQYRIPDFFRVDASFNIEAGHRLTKLTHSYFTVGVYNLTGRKNAYSVYFITEGNRVKGYQLSVFGVPLPYFSYNIKF